MKSRQVILSALVLVGSMIFLILSNTGEVAQKQRAQRVQGLNIVRQVSWSLSATNTPRLVPTAPR